MKEPEVDLNKMTPTERNIFDEAIDRMVDLLIVGTNEFNERFLFTTGKVGDRAKRFTTKERDFVVKEAQKRISVIRKRDIEFQYSLAVAQYEDLYRKCMTDKDYKACADILTKKCKLIGVGESNTSNVSNNGKIEIVHSYTTLGDRTDVSLNLDEFGDEKSPFPTN